ncbi:hypothetical protein GUJ93_ZPchr0001g30040 [Zizania palustris]|uniref:Uncharacterized protein n=1 Tax=Zizania palustris TaxID=103762 RepID=A0A8J5S8X5_ZIZPA|nr:hypothetical protein GUJ93_ZPchr0001g30040 [Zizania palustris]
MAAALDIVIAEAVLVPAVVYGLDVVGEHEEERRKRADVVDPGLLIHLHPLLDQKQEGVERCWIYGKELCQIWVGVTPELGWGWRRGEAGDLSRRAWG